MLSALGWAGRRRPPHEPQASARTPRAEGSETQWACGPLVKAVAPASVQAHQVRARASRLALPSAKRLPQIKGRITRRVTRIETLVRVGAGRVSVRSNLPPREMDRLQTGAAIEWRDLIRTFAAEPVVDRSPRPRGQGELEGVRVRENERSVG